ncbi:type IV minor pilin protein PilW [Alishewanella longhuensis]|uniref:Type IV minor pilin protein PilW n=1 Tax=Alishewanella longhuensis TaxID=1091037 RepID=A0ABQ3L0J7_9ALTE|nr:PilW family protein [Alishewanella longhuensis]GHG73997.1 type IV minor pilin protein PilW [Alishewanella longhuensis]
MTAKHGGFSLVEIMIAMVLALLLLMLILTAFSSLQSSSTQTRQLALLQQNGQLVLNLLNNELQNGGFWGGQSLLDINNAGSAIMAPSNDCFEAGLDTGSFPQFKQPFITLFSNTATGSRQLNCLNNLLPNTEFLQLKRSIGIQVTRNEMRNNRFYLQADWQQSRFVDIDTASGSSMLLFPYQHSVLYIQQQQLAGQSIPVLMRKRLVRNAAGAANMATDSIIDGVERLHFEFLIDSDLDGRPNYSLATSQMTPNHWLQQQSRIVAVQYHVLLRSLEPDRSYINDRHYQLGSLSYTAPGDHYRRLLLSGAVYFENTVLADR